MSEWIWLLPEVFKHARKQQQQTEKRQQKTHTHTKQHNNNNHLIRLLVSVNVKHHESWRIKTKKERKKERPPPPSNNNNNNNNKQTNKNQPSFFCISIDKTSKQVKACRWKYWLAHLISTCPGQLASLPRLPFKLERPDWRQDRRSKARLISLKIHACARAV